MACTGWWDQWTGAARRRPRGRAAGVAGARRAMLWGALPLVAACGGSPTGPGAAPPVPSTLLLSAGPHVLIVTGSSLGGACVALSTGTTGLMVPVQVEPLGAAWVVRPSAASGGDGVLSLRASGSDTPIAVGVTGTARGTLSESGGGGGSSAGARVTFEGDAVVTGEQLRGTRPLVGEMRGTIRFSDGTALAVSCSRVSWSLGPAS